jgi:hypothetical protein
VILLQPMEAPVREENPNHDRIGRFASGSGASQGGQWKFQPTKAEMLKNYHTMHGTKKTAALIKSKRFWPWLNPSKNPPTGHIKM